MSVTVANLLMGPAVLWHLPFDAADPLYADDETWKTAEGVRDLGGTDGGATATISQTYTPMTVDQIGMAVGARKTEQSVNIATSLAEATLDNLRAALNDVSGIGGTTGRIALSAEIANTEPEYAKVILEGLQPAGLGPRLVVIRRALSTESIGMSWTKDGKTMIPVTFSGYYVSATLAAVEIIDELNPVP